MVQVNPPFDIRKNFWKQNFAYKFLSPFGQLYQKDSSKNKEKSSRLMWCMWLYTSPHQYNPFKNIQGDRKLEAIQRYEATFDPEEYSEYIDAFELESLSAAAKAFKEEEESLIKRAKLIRKIQNELALIMESEDALEQIDEYSNLIAKVDIMRKNTKPIYEQYQAVKKEFESEQGEAQIFGGARETLLDKLGDGMIVHYDEEE